MNMNMNMNIDPVLLSLELLLNISSHQMVIRRKPWLYGGAVLEENISGALTNIEGRRSRC